MARVKLETLVPLAAAGDDEALRRIYSESRVMLLSMANIYYMVGAERDDVIQEGMIGLFYAIRTFDPAAGASFKTFAELCVKRRIINAVKMAGRKKHMPLNDSLSIEGEGETMEDTLRDPSEPEPEEAVLLADLVDYVGNNAPTVFSGFENMVWDAYIHGNSTDQISVMLGKSPKSVDNALTRIKGKIENLLSIY